MWICPRCETINEDEEKQCYICECDMTVFMEMQKKMYHQYSPESNFVLNEAVSELYSKKEEPTFQPEKKSRPDREHIELEELEYEIQTKKKSPVLYVLAGILAALVILFLVLIFI